MPAAMFIKHLPYKVPSFVRFTQTKVIMPTDAGKKPPSRTTNTSTPRPTRVSLSPTRARFNTAWTQANSLPPSRLYVPQESRHPAHAGSHPEPRSFWSPDISADSSPSLEGSGTAGADAQTKRRLQIPIISSGNPKSPSTYPTTNTSSPYAGRKKSLVRSPKSSKTEEKKFSETKSGRTRSATHHTNPMTVQTRHQPYAGSPQRPPGSTTTSYNPQASGNEGSRSRMRSGSESPISSSFQKWLEKEEKNMNQPSSMYEDPEADLGNFARREGRRD